MTTESNEQYRAGFEAMAQQRGLSLMRTREGSRYRFHVTGVAWETWVIAMREAEAQREASTEPSAIRDAALEEAIALCKKSRAWQCVDGIRALKNYGAAGALTDDAKAQPVIWQEACGESGGYWQDSSEADCKKYGFRHRIVRVLFDSEEAEAKAGSGT